MATRTLQLTSPQELAAGARPCGGAASFKLAGRTGSRRTGRKAALVPAVRAKAGGGDQPADGKGKQSLIGSITDALDFAAPRSARDAELLEEARESTKSGGRMSQEQYGALRRKIGGTYKDFFKSYVDVDGEYVEEGWVDKTCRVCGKDTRGEPRRVDGLGRYVHDACAGKPKSSAINTFFAKLFSSS